MGTFVKDNISGINIGSKSSNVSGKTVQSSNIDISNIERGSSEFTSNSNISSSVDFGDLFNDKASASEVSASSMTNGSTNIEGTNQTSSSVSQQGMSNDKVNQDSSNQQTGNAQSASLSNGKNEENNSSQATGRANPQGTTSGGNQGSSTGQSGGSAHGASTSSGKGPSGSKGATGAKASGNSMSGGNPASGRGGSDGHKAGGVEVKSTSVKNATRPTAFNNNSSMQQTGTTVSQKTVTSSKVETNASKAEKNTGSIIGKAVRWFVKEVVNVIEVIKATEVVIATSVLSAVGNIVEAVVIDGLVGYVVAGALDLLGIDDIANDLRKFAARDQVGEINKWFYEETDIGRQINELSAIKYDSAVAKGITSLSEMAIKIAAATAISLVPGGIFIVAGIGALEGMGNAAESAYQNALANGEEDLTLSVWSNLGILGSGALDAVAWVFNAKLGQGFLEIAGDIGTIGIKETTVNFGKQLISKDTIKNILNPKNLLMNMGQSGLQSGGQIGKIFSKFMNGEEIKPEDWWDLAQTYGTYLFLNIAEDVLKDTISNYKSVDNIKQMKLNSDDEPIEIKTEHDGYYKKRLQHYLDNGSTGEEARKLATRDTVALELTEHGFTEDKAKKIADMSIEGVKVETAIKVQQDIEALDAKEITFNELIEYYLNEDPDYQKALTNLLPKEEAFTLKETARYQKISSEIEGHKAEIAELENAKASIKNPAAIEEIDKNIKWNNDQIDNKTAFLDETVNIDQIAERQHDLLVKEYGDDALTTEQIKEILLTDQSSTRGAPGDRSKLPYLAEDSKLNMIQREKFKTSTNYKFGDVQVKAGETTGIKFCNTNAANNGYVGGFVANMDQVMEHIEEIKAKNPDMTQTEFIEDLEKFLDAKDFKHASPVIYHIEPDDIKIPNGDEFGAWPGYWKPGGLTTNGGLEVQTTIDSGGVIKPETGKYEIISFEDFYKAIFNK